MYICDTGGGLSFGKPPARGELGFTPLTLAPDPNLSLALYHAKK